MHNPWMAGPSPALTKSGTVSSRYERVEQRGSYDSRTTRKPKLAGMGAMKPPAKRLSFDTLGILHSIVRPPRSADGPGENAGCPRRSGSSPWVSIAYAVIIVGGCTCVVRSWFHSPSTTTVARQPS